MSCNHKPPFGAMVCDVCNPDEAPHPIDLAERFLDAYLRASAAERVKIEVGLQELIERFGRLWNHDGCGCDPAVSRDQCPDPDIAAEWGPCACEECHDG